MSAAEIRRLEDQIAQLRELEKTQFKPGELRAVVTMDAANRPITRYEGDQNACWDRFNPPYRYVRRFLTPGSR